jgi:hypothetical protein
MIDSFPIVPGGSRTLWFLTAIVGPILIGVFALLVATARGSAASRFELSHEGLRIRGDLYARMIPRSIILADSAKVVNLATERQLAPTMRTMGTSVPGYNSGWFRLRNGRKALLYLTDRTRAVHVPTTAGYDLLISPQDPERFVDRLRNGPR